MTKSSPNKQSLADSFDKMQDDAVGMEDVPFETADIDAPWTWPVRAPEGEEHFAPGKWGSVFLTPGGVGYPTDVRITFDPESLEGRRRAFAFAQALVSRLVEAKPGVQAEFMSAGDHYHVVIQDFGSRAEKLAAALVNTFRNSGGLSGRRSGRHRYSFTETSEHHVVRRR